MSATAMVPSVPRALSERLRSVTTVFSLERKEEKERKREERERKSGREGEGPLKLT